MYNIFFGKRRISLYLLQQPFATRNDLICCKTGLICGYLCPFYRTLRETFKALYNGTYTVVITCPALRSISCSWAIHRAQTPSYKAVPSMLTVAPSGRTKRLMRLSIPLYSSVHLIVVGKVAALG